MTLKTAKSLDSSSVDSATTVKVEVYPLVAFSDATIDTRNCSVEFCPTLISRFSRYAETSNELLPDVVEENRGWHEPRGKGIVAKIEYNYLECFEDGPQQHPPDCLFQ